MLRISSLSLLLAAVLAPAVSAQRMVRSSAGAGRMGVMPIMPMTRTLGASPLQALPLRAPMPSLTAASAAPMPLALAFPKSVATPVLSAGAVKLTAPTAMQGLRSAGAAVGTNGFGGREFDGAALSLHPDTFGAGSAAAGDVDARYKEARAAVVQAVGQQAEQWYAEAMRDIPAAMFAGDQKLVLKSVAMIDVVLKKFPEGSERRRHEAALLLRDQKPFAKTPEMKAILHHAMTLIGFATGGPAEPAVSVEARFEQELPAARAFVKAEVEKDSYAAWRLYYEILDAVSYRVLRRSHRLLGGIAVLDVLFEHFPKEVAVERRAKAAEVLRAAGTAISTSSEIREILDFGVKRFSAR